MVLVCEWWWITYDDEALVWTVEIDDEYGICTCDDDSDDVDGLCTWDDDDADGLCTCECENDNAGELFTEWWGEDNMLCTGEWDKDVTGEICIDGKEDYESAGMETNSSGKSGMKICNIDGGIWVEDECKLSWKGNIVSWKTTFLEIEMILVSKSSTMYPLKHEG